jgi:S1-C subfamily serine protease
MSTTTALRRLAVVGFAAAMAPGCVNAASTAPRAGAPREQEQARGDAATCNALGSLVDLKRAMLSSPTTSSSPLFALVDAEEELAYARVALQKLGARTPMQESVSELVTLLEARTRELGRATASTRDSYASAEGTLRNASTCRGVDLGKLAKQQDKREQKGDVAVARSKACEGTLRLWAATKGTELSSDVSTSGIAAQIGELRLDKGDALLRDRLAVALSAHATRLKQLRELSGSADPTKDQRALLDARNNVGELVETAFRGCVGQAGPTSVSARARTNRRAAVADPRSATVMVRPTWSGALKSLGAAERSFGSGFLVRWTRRDGRTETLVVTNRHVMEGAMEAEVLFASEIDTHDKRESGGARPAPAHLVAADEADDIAILRVDAEGAAAQAQGLTFRTDPPREQEVVVAAGFPGIGMKPSFQVTNGVISNAHFGSEERDVGIAYLQHTAAIDPGNSGGPLLDDAGRLLGMNTAKLHGRDNVSLAIPGARIRFALRRAEERRTLGVAHAEASCNLAIDALASEHPTMTSIARFGMPLFESAEKQADGGSGGSATRRHRARVVGSPSGPIDEARLRAFERAREDVERAGDGVLPFEACTKVAQVASPPGGAASFTASFRTRSGVAYRVGLSEESGVVRVASLSRAE